MTAPSSSEVGGTPAAPNAAVLRRKRMGRYLILAATVYAVTIIGGSYLLKHLSLSAPLRALVLAGIFGVLAVYLAVFVVTVRSADELQRRIQLEALAFAFPATIVASIVVEYLRKAQFIGEPRLGDVWPYFLGLYLAGYLYAAWRYRAFGGCRP